MQKRFCFNPISENLFPLATTLSLTLLFSACGQQYKTSSSQTPHPQATDANSSDSDTTDADQTNLPPSSPLPPPAKWAAHLVQTTDTTALTFRYDRFTNRCLNAQGQVGYNANHVGECGDLREQDLSGRDLTGLNLRGADFSEAKLKGTVFANADLRGANLLYANWRDAVFSGSLISEGTVLPFSRQDASAMGMSELTYPQLDSLLSQEFARLVQANAPAPFSHLQELLALGANIHLEQDRWLVEAVSHGNEQLVAFLVPQWFSPNTIVQSQHLLSYALYAPEERGYRVIQYLLEQGSDPNHLATDTTKSILAQAIERHSSQKLIELLVAKGADVNRCNKNASCSLLALAFKANKPSIVSLLLDKGADATWHNEQIPSLLDMANDVSVLDQLIARGADAKLAALWGRTNIPTIKFLVEKGADPRRQNPANGRTLLIEALLSKKKDLINLAMTLSHDASTKDRSGHTALSYALAERAYWSIAKQMVQEGADVDIRVSFNNRETSPLWLGADYDKDLFMLLANRGVDINKADPYRGSPFSYVVAKGTFNIDEISLLIQKGGDVNSSTFISVDAYQYLVPSITDRQVPLLSAVIANYPCGENKAKVVALLLEKGSQAHALGQDKISALHVAAATAGSYSNYANCAPTYINLLLTHGLDVNQATASGITPVMFAANNMLVTQSLIAAGAKVDIAAYDYSVSYSVAATAPCDSEIPQQTEWYRFLQKVISLGAPAPIVRSDSKITLGHVVGDKIAYAYADSIGNYNCVDQLFKSMRPQLGGLNALDRDGKSPIYRSLVQVVRGYGGGANWLREPSVLATDRAAMTNFYANRLHEGWDPRQENQKPFNKRSLALAYNIQNLSLVKLLKQAGAEDFMPSPGQNSRATPTNACAFFPQVAGYQLNHGGCLSPHGILWSVPSTMDKCTAGADGNLTCSATGATGLVTVDRTHKWSIDSYCSNLRQGGRYDWRSPSFAEVARESLSGGWRYANHQFPFGKILLEDANWPYPEKIVVLRFDTRTNTFIRWSHQSETLALKTMVVCVAGTPTPEADIY